MSPRCWARQPGERLEASVAFVDMIGSTTLTEAVGAGPAARFLEATHARIGDAAQAHGGMVVEIWGDGALVVFGVDGAPRHAARALQFLRAVAAPPGAAEAPALRATAHMGVVAISDLGAGAQRHLSLTGDTVNAAARLQDVAKTLRVRLVVSAELAEAAGAPDWLEDGGAVSLRGRRAALSVFSAIPET